MTVADTAPQWETAIEAFLAEPVPDDILQRGDWVLADVLAAMAAGAKYDPYPAVWRDVDLPSGPSTVVGTDRQTDPMHAASLNGITAIAQEIEEGHNTGGHVGAGIVAGGVAAGEHHDVDGTDLIEAVVKAYEVTARLENALFVLKDRINADSPWLFRDPHSTWTTVGPALAASLVHTDATTAHEAMRLAANRAVISMHDPYQEGPPSRNVTAGSSAGVGVFMATLAAGGLAGSSAVMSTVYDPFEKLIPEGFASRFDDLGEHWAIEESYFKPYPSCRYTHAPLDALLDIIDDVTVDEIEHIEVETYGNAVDMDGTHPTTPTGAKFSIPYVLAITLVRGPPTFEDFAPAAIENPTVQSLAERVELTADAEFEAAFPEDWGARVRVHHTDGTTVVGERPYPAGDYRDPFSQGEFEQRLGDILSFAGLSGDGIVETLMDPRSTSARAIGATLRT